MLHIIAVWAMTPLHDWAEEEKSKEEKEDGNTKLAVLRLTDVDGLRQIDFFIFLYNRIILSAYCFPFSGLKKF